MVVDDPEHIRCAVIYVQSIALQGEDVVMFGDNNGDANINIRQQAQVLVVDQTGGLTYVSVSMQLHGGGNCAHGASPCTTGNGVPCNFDLLSCLEAAHVRFVDKGASEHMRKIGFLQEQISGLHKGSEFHRKGINDALERGAHARLAKSVRSEER